MRVISFLALSACSSTLDPLTEYPFGDDETTIEYGPTPAMEVTCATPYNDVSEGCGYIWAYDTSGKHLTLAYEQLAGEADPNGSPNIEVGDRIWFHNEGQEFIAFWPSDYTFDYALFGQEVWLNAIDCSNSLENGDNIVDPEEWDCVHLYPTY